MADGSVEHDRAVASDAQLEAGVHTAAVEIDGCSPHRLNSVSRQPALGRVRLRTDSGDRLDIALHADQPHSRKTGRARDRAPRWKPDAHENRASRSARMR